MRIDAWKFPDLGIICQNRPAHHHRRVVTAFNVDAAAIEKKRMRSHQKKLTLLCVGSRNATYHKDEFQSKNPINRQQTKSKKISPYGFVRENVHVSNFEEICSQKLVSTKPI